jgi:RNA polymerase sigma-70 factor, ECF subfamily
VPESLLEEVRSGSHPEEEEKRLVEGIRRGDLVSFDRVYSAYSARLFSFLLRLSGRRDTAEDLSQEMWIKFAKAGPSLREDTRLGPYLFTIARNAFISHRRWAMLDISRLVTVGFDAVTAISADPTPDEEHERAAAIALLETALASLPVASKEVLLLIGVEGLDQEEVAKMLGISYEACRQRLSRARAQLAEKMSSLEKRRKPTSASVQQQKEPAA